jgi:DNA polymerase-3 subunit epsilon
VRQASREIDAERSRLAALMAELTQSVVVCNLDGRILLYNSRARLQFRALSDAGAAGAGGAELLGIGRSIYGVFDRQLVAHALDGVQQRLQRGAPTRPRSSSPAPAAGSCCACRWRRCARWTTPRHTRC